MTPARHTFVMLTINMREKYETLLDAAALRGGDDPAIIYVRGDEPDVVVTRTEFAAHARRTAAALARLGIGPRDLLIVAHTQNLESVYAFWGGLLLGAVPSMLPTLTEKLDPGIYRRNMGELIHRSGVRAVLTSDEFAPELNRQVGCPVYSTADLAHASTAGGTGRVAQPDPEELALLQHSSGTTGLQKGVALSHRAVLNQLAACATALDLRPDDVVVSWLPLYHDMGLIAGFLLPLVQGIPLVLMSPFQWVRRPALLLRAIQRYGGTLCWLPNFAYNHCARRIRRRDLEGLSLGSMRLFINCSEPVRHATHHLFLERFGPMGVTAEMLGASYAMAENTFAVTQTDPGRAAPVRWVDRRELAEALRAVEVAETHPRAVAHVSSGSAIPNTEIRIVQNGGEGVGGNRPVPTPLPDGHVGEIEIRSDCLLNGYYRRPDLDPFTVDGWYRTGDRGYVVGGQVYVIGRSKDVIINAGKNVYPQDIEAIVNRVPGVYPGRAVVFGVPDAREGTELIGMVAETEADDPATRREIEREIRRRVAAETEVTLSYVAVVDRQWLIKTSSGKIARGANREKWRRMGRGSAADSQ